VIVVQYDHDEQDQRHKESRTYLVVEPFIATVEEGEEAIVV
jgi:hypothetical protein